jgi:hypothetical protein
MRGHAACFTSTFPLTSEFENVALSLYAWSAVRNCPVAADSDRDKLIGGIVIAPRLLPSLSKIEGAFDPPESLDGVIEVAVVGEFAPWPCPVPEVSCQNCQFSRARAAPRLEE